MAASIASAIAPRVAMQSEQLGRNFQNIGQQQAGAAARTNAPVSIKNALASALDVAQARGQRDITREAMTDSEQLRRQDLEQTYKVLQMVLDYINSGRGLATQSANINAQMANQNKGAMIGAGGQLLGGLASGMNSGTGNPTSSPVTTGPSNYWEPGYYVTR